MNSSQIIRVLAATSVLWLLAPLAWAAEECSTIRLDAAGGPLHMVAVANQRSAPACRYFTAAEVIQAALFYQSPHSKSISWVGLFANAADNRSNPGNFASLVNIAKVEGVCSSEKVEQLVRESTLSCRQAAELRASVLGADDRLTTRALGDCEGMPSEDGFERQTAWKLSKIVGANGSSRSDLRDRLRSACTQDIIDVSALGSVEYTFGYEFKDPITRFDALRHHIDRSLTSAKPTPVGIHYCVDVLRKLDAVGVKSDNGKHTERLCSDGLHASSIIGRRSNRGQCQYLIKNSWGSSCSGYDPRTECEGGKLWVDARALINNVIFVQGLSTK